MDSENITTTPKKQRRNTKKSPLLVVLLFGVLFLVCLLVFFFFFLNGHGDSEVKQNKQGVGFSESAVQQLPTSTNETNTSVLATKKDPQIFSLNEKDIGLSQNKESNSALNNSNSKSVEENETERTEGSTPQSSPIIKDSICDQSYDVIHKFLLHLDNQEYIHQYTDGEKSEVYFIELIQKLGDNPPVVSRETDDLFTILKNTAHFFRIIGKDNILALKGILANEKDQFEVVLSHFYKMTQNENCLNEKLQLNLSKDTLYDYAGFFLNTMGGRLYLFRRDSVSRLTVSYYSILLIEQANRQGRNVHGLDIRPAVELLIPEIENSGSQLRLKDTYLEKLYELEDRMN